MNVKIFYFLLVLFSISCHDGFLEKYPIDSISDENFWESSSDLKTYANQFYPRFDYVRSYIGGSTSMNNWSRREANSDNYCLSSRYDYIWNEYSIPSTGGGWAKSDWSAIRSINYALSRLDKLDPDDPE